MRFENADGGQHAVRVLASATAEGFVLDAEIPQHPLLSGNYDAIVVTKEGSKIIKTNASAVTCLQKPSVAVDAAIVPGRCRVAFDCDDEGGEVALADDLPKLLFGSEHAGAVQPHRHLAR